MSSVWPSWKTVVWINSYLIQFHDVQPRLHAEPVERLIKGINIDGGYLNHLRFADDISNTTEASTELQQMLDNLNRESKKVVLKMYKSKTMIMFNDKVNPQAIKINGEDLEQVDEYIYLGQILYK